MKLTKTQIWIVASVIALIVIALVWFFAFFSIKEESSRFSTQTNTTSAEKVSKFATLKGSAFDEAYVADMLAHHEGAVNMAEQAQAMTAHEEIRIFAGNITTAQSLEILKMRQWQIDWGYEVTMSGGHMSQGGGGMEMSGDMVEMMNNFDGLTGEAYDKEFLKQMIIHHQQAVDMSQYAEANAQHAEVKQLARAIISSQSEEVQQMKQWQIEWGYNQ